MTLSPLPALLLPATALAVAVALHVSTWGAFKDSAYEGYHPGRQLRTLLLAVLAAGALLITGVADPHALLPALGAVYGLERLMTEWWKSIVRSDDQTAYTIPMRLGFRGRPVESSGLRWAVGLAVAAGLAVTGLGIGLAQQGLGSAPQWLVVLTVGGLGGWLTAVGGAWKDAPVEGFSGWKFLRSPAVATAWAVPLSFLTDNWVTLGLAAAGMAVASIETYKTFLTRGRAPGKFEGKPVRWVQPGLKRALGRVHAASWAAFGAVSLSQVGHAGDAVSTIAAGAAVVVCAVAVVVVLRATTGLTGPTPATVGDLHAQDELLDELVA